MMLVLLAWPGGLRAEEEDILEIAQRHPLHIISSAGPVKYGDPDLDDAVAGLSDIPHPWTVSKIIAAFEDERREWAQKMELRERGANSFTEAQYEEECKRLRRLAMLLAASRDPRAAVALEKAYDEKPHFEFLKGRVMRGLYSYFLSDPRYRSLPKEEEDTEVRFYSNFLPEMNRRVLAWRKLNDEELKKAMETAVAK